MKYLKSSLLIVSVLFLFAGVIGVDMFSDSCQRNDLAVAYSTEGDHCCKVDLDDSDPCCKSLYEDSNCCEDEDCCDDELYHIQLRLDFFNSITISPVIIPEIVVELYYEYLKVPTKLSYSGGQIESPPPESGRALILKKQHWLI